MSKILIDEATVKLVLEALESCDAAHITDGGHQWYDEKLVDTAYAALQEALAEQPAQQDSTCSNALREQGKAYPRTCKKCGLGPCVELAQQALDKMAENARELGLDYEPAQQKPVATCPQDIIHAITLYGDARADQDANNAPTTSHERLADCIRLVRKALAEQPAQRKPLTDEEIIASNYPDGEENGPTIAAPDFELVAFARQIEAAHGIKTYGKASGYENSNK